MPRPARLPIPLLEVEVTPISARDTAALVVECAKAGSGLVVGNLNLHGVFVYHTDPDFREFCDSSDLVIVDGAPIAWAARVPTKLRVGSTDWLDLMMPFASGLRIVAIGGTEAAARGAERHMLRSFPAVEWVGVNGFAGSEVGPDLRAKIADAQIVLVGMGMPLQERWLLDNRYLLTHKVVANVGGCFDYYAGVQRLAPRWMGRVGMEWLYRLARDPRRLATRYLLEPLRLVRLLVARRIARRRHAAKKTGSSQSGV